MRRLLITGSDSGCGKTTITCAILAALKAKDENPLAFKCGPDYVDPMFHRSVSRVKAYNLDPFFLDGNGLRKSLTLNEKKWDKSIGIIEGAMGYYDGIGSSHEASAYTVAKETQTPVILVVNAKGKGNSLGALISGFAAYRPDNQIKGVIFNNLTEGRYKDMVQISRTAGVKAYGYFPTKKEFEIPGRNLGLFAADEIPDLQDKLKALGDQASESLDLEGLLKLAATAPGLNDYTDPGRIQKSGAGPRLAMARDQAFCFFYQENLDLLEALGCQLVFFSPLRDKELPENIDGLYLGGGYPDLYKQALSDNHSMRESIKTSIEKGLPTIAEGGGFLYLHRKFADLPMCGVIEANASEIDKLRRFGYISLQAQKDNLLCKKGEQIRSHEFHYWDSTDSGSDFIIKKAGRDLTYEGIHAGPDLYAGFPYLYLPANENFSGNFVERMTAYSKQAREKENNYD